MEECKFRQVFSAEDLPGRVVSESEYQEKWDKWCDRMHTEFEEEITIAEYTEEKIPDVLAFEKELRAEEVDWGWEIDDRYIGMVSSSFHDPRFGNALSLLAYLNGRVAGRIDAVRIPSHFDGSVKAYLDWICVLKSCRHRGIAQKLLSELRERLKAEGIDTLIALTASNEEAQRFYKAVPDSEMKDIGIWIDTK